MSALSTFRYKCLKPGIAGLFVILLCPGLFGQWQTTVYSLKGGWNAIYLHGDLTHTGIDELFSTGDGLSVEEIWRWNANPGETQFTESPLVPSPGVPEWSVWRRGLPEQSNLSSLIGQTAYLVKCSGDEADSYSVSLKTRVLPPSSTWVRSGANLLGFPANFNGSTYPTLSAYFATFPVAIAANSKVYKYTGGELGPANPVQVFSPISELLDRNKAYWFEADVVSNFYAPLEISTTLASGLDFGGSVSNIGIRIRNRSSSTVTVTFSPMPSESSPAGQPSIIGTVPLTLRSYDSINFEWIETPITGSFDRIIGPQESIEVNLGIDRSSMTGDVADYYASLLRIRDSGNLMDIYLPASASVPSLAGLWVGEATISNVESKVASSQGTTTPRSYPLRLLMHVDDTGNARLLSQVFMGALAREGNPVGLCTKEVGLQQDLKASARRITVSHLPLDRVIDQSSPGSSGSVELGATLVRTIEIPYTDPTNPFMHQYHPDHDNKNARPDGTSENLVEGVESYTVTRTCSFEFSLSPPVGISSLGWGTSAIGGVYTETLSGLHRETITVSGTFVLRRASEETTININ